MKLIASLLQKITKKNSQRLSKRLKEFKSMLPVKMQLIKKLALKLIAVIVVLTLHH